jgi:hypothetical protein
LWGWRFAPGGPRAGESRRRSERTPSPGGGAAQAVGGPAVRARDTGRRLGFAGARGAAFIGTGPEAFLARTPRTGQRQAPCRGGGLWLGQMGLAGPSHRAGGRGSERVGILGPAQTERVVLYIFFEFIFNDRNNSRNYRNCFKGTKNTRKITKIQENS